MGMYRINQKLTIFLLASVLIAACGKQGTPQYAPAAEPAPVNTAAPMAKMAADIVAANTDGAEQTLMQIREPTQAPQANSDVR